MMNIIGLSLVVASLVSAGVWSPKYPKTLDNRDVIVKEGHRVVIVEYDQDEQPITKVSISPEPNLFPRRTHDPENPKEDYHHLPNLGHGLSTPIDDFDGTDQPPRRGPRELICDAYGKCRHKISDAIGRTKETVSDAAEITKRRVEEAVGSTEEAVVRVAHDTVDKVQDTKHHVEMAAEKAKDTTHRAEEVVSGTARHATKKAKDATHRAEEAVYATARHAAEKVKETTQRAEEVVHATAPHAAEKTKNAAETAEKLRRKGHEMEDHVREAAKTVSDLGKTIGVDVAKNVTGWFGGPGEKMAAALHLSAAKLNPVSGVLYTAAFSTAFGTGLWVTFVQSYLLARAVPRQQFAVVQSRVYPVYFRTMAVAIGVALAGFMVSQGVKLLNNFSELKQVYNLMGSLLIVLVNMLFLEPKATKVMFEKLKLEKEEGRGRGEVSGERRQPAAETPSSTAGEASAAALTGRLSSLEKKLKKLNTVSSVLNILSLMALSCHVYYLGNRLHITYKL